MITLDPSDISYTTLFDFALGKLTAHEALKVTTEVGRNPKVHTDLEFVFKVLNLAQKEGDGAGEKPGS